MATTVTTFAQLQAALLAADQTAANTGAIEIDVKGAIAETADPTAINLATGNTLLIEGVADANNNAGALNGQSAHRGLFVYSGNVTIQDLVIENAVAQGGAGGGVRGGGGAGLGGGLYVAADTADGAAASQVTLNNVSFTGDAAKGGAGGTGTTAYGAGGGLGGSGSGNGTGGGGGGIGGTATGGARNAAGGAGIVPTFTSMTEGANGGGGNGGSASGAGGGIKGFAAPSSGKGGAGGYGGGGGEGSSGGGGAGGFGGGGGGGVSSGGGGGGGFGGGGGAHGADGTTTPGGAGGFGGGNGGFSGGGGGGGLGAGGDIFVQSGASLVIKGTVSLANGSVTTGTTTGRNGATAGQAFASGIYFQGTNTLTFDTVDASGNATTQTVGDVIGDDTGSAAAAGYGGVTGYTEGKATVVAEGTGTLVLSKADTYSGGTSLRGGTLELALATGAGTGAITFGSNPATLQIDAALGNGTQFADTLSSFVGGDIIDLRGLGYATGAAATVSGSILTVTSNGVSNKFALSNPSMTPYSVVNDGHNGSEVIYSLSPTVTGVQTATQTTTSEMPIMPFSTVAVGDANNGGANSDTLTITQTGTGALSSGGTALQGTTAGNTTTYTLTGTASALQMQLDGLSFTPVDGVPNTSVTTSFTLQAADAAAGTNSGTSGTVAVTDTDPAVAPTITNGSTAQASTSEAPVTPFGGATVGDANAAAGSATAGTATDTLTITLSGGNGGTLSEGSGFGGPQTLAQTGASTYTLTGTGAAITAELDQLSFTPTAGAANTSSTTTFTLSDTSTVGGASNTDATSTATDTDPPVAPTITNGSTAQTSTSEAPVTPFGGATVGDANAAAGSATAGTATDTLTITLSGGNGGMLTEGSGFGGPQTLAQTGASTYTLTGTGAAITAELDQLSFTPTAGAANTSSTTTFTLSDTSTVGGASNTDATSTATDTDPAVAPTITNGSTAQASTSEAPVTPFGGATVGDANAAAGSATAGTATDTLTITLSGGNGGTLSEGSGFGGPQTLAQTGASTYTLTGTGAAITAELDQLSFTPTAGAANTSSTTTFTLSDTSTVGGASNTDATSTATDTDPPVAPTITNGSTAQTSTSEAPVTPFGGATVGDANAAAGSATAGTATDTLTITLSGGNGGMLSEGSGFGGTPTLAQTGASTYTLTGTGAAITAELDQLSFTPTAGAANTSSTTTFTLSDTSTVGGASNTDATSTATDTDPAVAPTITNGSTAQASTSEAPVTPFGGATVGDANAAAGSATAGTATDTLTITLSGGNGGTLNEGSGFGGTPTLAQTGASTYTLTGTGAAITAELDQLSFTPTAGAANTSSTTTFTLSDTSTVGGASNTDATSTATDTDPAVAPTITNGSTAQASTSEAPVTPFGGATVGDANAAAGSATAGTATDTLTITLSGGNGGTLSEGSGFGGTPTLAQTGASTYTLTGTGAAITAELDQLSFTPTAGAANTSSTTTFTLSDTSTVGGASNTDATSTATDTDPAVAPTITNGSTAQASTSEAPVTPFGGATVGDANAAAGSATAGTATDTLTITLSGGNGGMLSEGSGFGGPQTLAQTGASTYTLTGTGAAITAELDQLSFTPTAGAANTSSTTTFTLSDTSTVGGASNTDATSTATDTDPPVAPTITNGSTAQASTSEAPVTPFGGATVGDANAAAGSATAGTATDTLTITLSGGNGGMLSEGSGFGGPQTLAQTGASTYTLTGTGAAITAELDQLSFTPTAGAANTSSTTTFTLSDTSTVGGASNTDATSTATDTDPAVAPTITNGSTAQTSTSEAPVTPFGGATVGDANAAAGSATAGTATDTLTITLSGGNGGTLSEGSGFGGTPTLAQTGASTYTLTGTGAAITAELDQLSFTPTAGAANTSSTTTFTLSDTSTVGGASNTDANSTATDTDPPVAPSISGTHTTGVTDNASSAPFSGVTIGDANANSTDTVTIQLSNAGAGGTLSGTGLTANGNGSYTLASGIATSVTSALDALSFTPTAPPPGTSATTTFVLNDTTSAGTSVSDAGTSVTDTAAAAPPPPPSPAPPHIPAPPPSPAPPHIPVPPPAPDTVSFDTSAAFAGHGTFVLTGTATSPAGVRSVEISAMVDGVETDLGAAAVNANGTFTFTDDVGSHAQGSITATATDITGGTVSAMAPFDLAAGLRGIPGQPYGADETFLDAGGNVTGTTYFERDGTVLFSSTDQTLPNGGSSYTYSNGAYFDDKPFASFTDVYRPDGQLAAVHELDGTNGTHKLIAEMNGVTLHSQSDDTMIGSGARDRFVFSPGFGQDTVANFNLSGGNHDTLSLASSDFTSLAQVLRETRDTAAGAVIHDAKSPGDTILLAGITKAELKAHPQDFAFHA